MVWSYIKESQSLHNFPASFFPLLMDTVSRIPPPVVAGGHPGGVESWEFTQGHTGSFKQSDMAGLCVESGKHRCLED